MYFHAISNESVIEHTFGFTHKQGQGHHQDQKEYVESKRRHSVDFHIRNAETPFCQYVKTKLRDIGYQCLIDSGKIKLSANDIEDIFKAKIDFETVRMAFLKA